MRAIPTIVDRVVSKALSSWIPIEIKSFVAKQLEVVIIARDSRKAGVISACIMGPWSNDSLPVACHSCSLVVPRSYMTGS